MGHEPNRDFLVPPSKSNSLFDFAKTGIASASLALALTSFAQAQQFQEPTLPSPTPAAIQQPALQSRIAHAEALKAQMERARREQGGTDAFAQKAYEAQQTYQTELAYQEYQAYLAKQSSTSQAYEAAASSTPNSYGVAQAQHQQSAPAFKKLPKPNRAAPNSATQGPDTFVPPVHVAPTSKPAVASFGDQPRIHLEELQYAPQIQTAGQVATNEPIGTGVLQQTSYQEPIHNGYGDRSMYQNGPRAQPQAYVATQNYAQPARAPQVSPAQLRATKLRQSYTPPRVAPPAYILSENKSVGLQDKIASLLSKPRYRGISESTASKTNRPMTTPPVDQRNYRSANLGSTNSSGRKTVATQSSASTRGARSTQPSFQNQPNRSYTPNRQPRQPLYAPERNRQIPGQQAQAQRLRANPLAQQQAQARQAEAAKYARSNKIRRDLAVQQAFEMQQRIPTSAQRRRPVQQVAMLEPAQDPFNDQPSMTIPPMNQVPTMRSPRASYPLAQPAGRPVQRLSQPANELPFRANPKIRASSQGSFEQEPAIPTRQISILRNRNQDQTQDSKQFGSDAPAQQPTEDIPGQGGQIGAGNQAQPDPFGIQSEQDLQKIDDDLNRRLKLLEQQNESDESSSFDETVRQLENELRNNRSDEARESVVDDDEDSMSEGLDEDEDENLPMLTEQSCDEFRAVLLSGSIRDISLDLSPLASPNRFQMDAISRSWTDRSGNVVADGTMVDLRRGYVIIDGVNGLQKIPYAKLSDADWAAISEYWRLPTLCSVGNDGVANRNWIPQTYTWKASALCHKPLFFENIQLERYGHSHGPFTQPIQSVGHFFVSLITVPYQSGITPATECQYALGFYRPGNCAPWLKDPIPLSLSGAARQALITTGLALIP